MDRLHRDADRFIAAVLGLYFLYAAAWLWQLWRSEPSYTFYDWLWPEVFATAGLLGLTFALRPSSRRICAWSGGLMVGALMSRAFAIVAAWQASSGAALSTARTFFALGTWSALAFCVGVIWILLRPRGSR